MRQTSRAVALLLTLESASAAPTQVSQNSGINFTTLTNVPVATIYDAAQTLIDRQAPWQQNAASYVTALKWATGVSKQAATGASGAGTAYLSVTAGSGCVQCILGGAVWCSRTYSYLITSGDYNYTVTTVAANTFIETKLATDATTMFKGTVDAGSCCGTAAEFVVFAGKIGTDGAVANVAVSQSASAGNGASCVAMTTSITAGAATNAWELAGSQYKSWWCSNGLYGNFTASTVGTYNNIQPFNISDNNRTELSLMACPQKAATCGITGTSTVIDNIQTTLTTTTATAVPIIVKTAAGPALTDKCTWVAVANVAAPTFTIGKTTESTNYGLATLNWQVHTVEYNGVDLTLDAGSVGYMGSGHLAAGNAVPLPLMAQAKFMTLRTWYGLGSSATGTSNWNAPYQNHLAASSTSLDANAGQYYGNVASFPASTTTTNWGAAYDGRVVRYFPAKVAQASWAAGDALYGASGSFATANTAYTTAKTTWNAYVAILAKNAKADAFAAAFSPPKAPTVPPLPSRPWVPGAYGGLYFLTNAKYAKMAYEQGAGALTAAGQPTNQEFWLTKDAAWNGGWGTFTAQIVKFRDGWGKSFGTIGYSKDTSGSSGTLSAVYNYKWTCSGNTGSASTVCDQSYSNAATPVASASAANAVKLYVAVSIWSLGNSLSTGTMDYATVNNFAGSATGGSGTPAKNDFMLTFTGKAWSEELVKLTSFATPTQPAAASSLSGIAGAQALAASAAAALAAAAALY